MCCPIRDIFRALLVDELVMCFPGRSLDRIEIFKAGSICHTGIGDTK